MTRQFTTTLLTLALIAFINIGCEEAAPLQAESTVVPEQALQQGTATANTPGQGSKAKAAVYMADLTPLNDSGVSGKAQFKVKNNTFIAQVNAQGLATSQVHPQHIHGFTDGTVSTCPTAAADTDGDGLVSVGEGAPFYGGVLVPLDGSLDVAEGLGDLGTFPTADNGGGAVTYRQTMSLSNLAVNGGLGFDALTLDNHAVVLHGAFVDGEYVATLPVACGTITRIN